MHLLESLNRRAVGVGFAVAMTMIGIGFLVVGTNPSDAEMSLVFWPATVVGGAAVLTIVHRDYRAKGDGERGSPDK
jgi:hypothetical protein